MIYGYLLDPPGSRLKIAGVSRKRVHRPRMRLLQMEPCEEIRKIGFRSAARPQPKDPTRRYFRLTAALLQVSK